MTFLAGDVNSLLGGPDYTRTSPASQHYKSVEINNKFTKLIYVKYCKTKSG